MAHGCQKEMLWPHDRKILTIHLLVIQNALNATASSFFRNHAYLNNKQVLLFSQRFQTLHDEERCSFVCKRPHNILLLTYAAAFTANDSIKSAKISPPPSTFALLNRKETVEFSLHTTGTEESSSTSNTSQSCEDSDSSRSEIHSAVSLSWSHAGTDWMIEIPFIEKSSLQNELNEEIEASENVFEVDVSKHGSCDRDDEDIDIEVEEMSLMDDPSFVTLPVLLVKPCTGQFEILCCAIDQAGPVTVGSILEQVVKVAQQEIFQNESYAGICQADGTLLPINDDLSSEVGEQVLVAIPRHVSVEKCCQMARGILCEDKMIKLVSIRSWRG